MNTLTLAIISGLLYFMGTQRIGYGFSTTTGAPVTLGFIFGLLFGVPTQGLILGASINLLYLGVVATGGNVPSDGALASCVAIPVALQLNLDVDTAVAIAVPFGILGAFIDQIRRTSNLIWLHKADKYAADGNAKGVYLCAMVFPTLVAFFIRFIPVFAITLFGANAVETLLTFLPGFITTGLAVAGGILPAIGFAVIIMSIGRKELLPYYFIGFFSIKYLGIGTMATAVFGLCIVAIIFFNFKKKEELVNE